MKLIHVVVFPLLVLLAVEVRPQSRPESGPARPARIFGQVLGRDGKPAGGAVVYAIRPKTSVSAVPISVGHALPEAEDSDELSVKADADGNFRIEAGDFEFFGLWAERNDEASTLHFPVVTGDPVILRLEATQKVEGRVIEEREGAEPLPVAGAEVEVKLGSALASSYNWSGLRWPAWIRRVRSGRDGEFSLRVAESATATVRASMAGKSSPETWRDPRRAEPLLLSLSPEKTLRGTVVDEKTGEPVSGAEVRWRIGERRGALTDEKGRFALSPVLKTSEILVISKSHQLAAARPSQDELAGTSEVQVALVPGIRLEARLLREDGTPLVGARVLFATRYQVGDPAKGGRSGGSTSFMGEVGAAGAVRLAWLQPEIPVAAFVEVDGSWVRFAWVCPKTDVKIGDVKVSAGTRIEGTVLAPDGSPVVSAAVRLLPDLGDATEPLLAGMGNQWIGAVTNRAGKFRFRGLLPGRYRIGAMAVGQGYVIADAVAASDPRPLTLRLPTGEAIEGKVVDADDHAIPDAGVVAHARARDPGASSLWFNFFWCRTDSAGRFTLRGLPSGAFTVEAGTTRKGTRWSGQIPSVPAGEKDLTIVLEESK